MDDIEAHRLRLAATVRASAQWREEKAAQYADDYQARKASLRAVGALRSLANFVEGLPSDDRDLKSLLHSEWSDGRERYVLCDEALDVFSRFGLTRGFWVGKSRPSEDQMRNALRRAEGAEARDRGLR